MMINSRFILRSDKEQLTVKGGYLHQVAELQQECRPDKSNKSIDFIIEEGSGLEAFERKLSNTIKRNSMLSYLLLLLNNRLGSVLTVFISLVIIILIALLSIHGSLTYDLFSGSSSSNIFNFNGIYLYLILSLFILFFLVASPRIILGDYDNLFDWANSRFSSNARIQRRLMRALVILQKVCGEKQEINLWNPLSQGMDSWVVKQLMPALSSIPGKVNIMIRTDEKEALLDAFHTLGMEITFTAQPVDKDEVIKTKYPHHLLSTWERECMHCVLFSSMISLPEAWKENINGREIIISNELAERIYNLYEPKLSISGKGNATFKKFLDRCIVDYAFLSTTADQRVQNLVMADTSLHEALDQALMDDIGDTVKNNLGSLAVNITDPLALVILIGITATDQALDTRKIELVKEFIRNVRRIENYWLINDYWKHIARQEKQEDGQFTLGLLQFMDVKTLGDLSTCFVNSGMYDNALEVFDILEHIYPAKIAIEIADLKDSLGENKEALEIALKADKDWVSSGIVEDKALILELYLNIAWVIVSGRFEDHKKVGYQYLSKTENILQKLPDTGNFILFLTRYYNTLANYHEWEKNYGLAIENYEKALKLPGSILRKSSLLSNRGTAERFLGKDATTLEQQREHFITSRSNLRQAVSMKKSIGEKNQIPGSSNNLAETLVELARITEDKTEKIKMLKEADEVTSIALGILDEIKSMKRRGRLIAEKFIAHHLLKGIDEPNDEARIKQDLDEWLKAEDKESYDYRVVKELLGRFGFEI
jgi:tetratricopeptide (TPR) repeat protein